MSVRVFIILFCLCLFAYFFFGYRNIGSELIIDPQTVIIPEKQNVVQSPVIEKTFGFHIQDKFGYITESSKLIFLETVNKNLTYNDTCFINAPLQPVNPICQDSRGNFLFTINAAGYPIFRRQNLYMLNQDTMGISEWNEQGNRLWKRDFGQLITCVDACREFTAVGFLNGSCLFITHSGKIQSHRIMDHKNNPILYNVSISPSGKIIAVIHGTKPQMLQIMEYASGQFQKTMAITLPTAFRRNCFLKIGMDNDSVFIEQDQGVLVFRLSTGRLHSVYLASTLSAAEFNSFYSFFIFYSSLGNNRYLTLCGKDYQPIVSSEYAADHSFFKMDGRNVFLGKDNRLLKLKIREN